MSRRQFLSRAGALGLGGTALSSGCRAGTGGVPSAGADDRRLHVDNWAAYIDPTRDGMPGTVDRFRQATGIDLRYTEGVNDNNEYFAKIQPVLAAGRTIEPDLIVLTSWMAERLIRLGWLDPLPLDQMQNRDRLRDEFQAPSWDPTSRYTLPWQTVLVGIGYNRKAAGREIRGVADLLAPDLKGKVGMLTEMRDTIGLLMIGLGRDPSSITAFDQAAPALEQLERAKRDGQIRAFTGNDFLDDLSNGNFAACMAWSADGLQIAKENPDVRFIIPEEGGLRGVDTMIMPKGAAHRDAARRWMDFVYDPAEAARITAFVQAVTPVKGVQQELARIDKALAAHPLVFPDEATNARLKVFSNLTDAVEQQLDEAFSRIIGA